MPVVSVTFFRLTLNIRPKTISETLEAVADCLDRPEAMEERETREELAWGERSTATVHSHGLRARDDLQPTS